MTAYMLVQGTVTDEERYEQYRQAAELEIWAIPGPQPPGSKA